MTDYFGINSYRGDDVAGCDGRGAQARGMRDAAYESGRPHGLAVSRYAQGILIDTEFAQSTPSAEASGGKLLGALCHRARQVHRFGRQQRRRVAGLAQLSDDDTCGEQARKERRQI